MSYVHVARNSYQFSPFIFPFLNSEFLSCALHGGARFQIGGRASHKTPSSTQALFSTSPVRIEPIMKISSVVTIDYRTPEAARTRPSLPEAPHRKKPRSDGDTVVSLDIQGIYKTPPPQAKVRRCSGGSGSTEYFTASEGRSPVVVSRPTAAAAEERSGGPPLLPDLASPVLLLPRPPPSTPAIKLPHSVGDTHTANVGSISDALADPRNLDELFIGKSKGDDDDGNGSSTETSAAKVLVALGLKGSRV